MTTVSERGTLVCRRPDGTVDLFRARRGGDDGVLRRAIGTSPRTVTGLVDWRIERRGLPVEAVAEAVDYLATDVVYWTGLGGTTVFLPLWFGLPGWRADPGLGAMVPVGSLPGARRMRRTWRGLRGALAGAIETGRLPAVAAPAVLVASLPRRGLVLPEPVRGVVCHHTPPAGE